MHLVLLVFCSLCFFKSICWEQASQSSPETDLLVPCLSPTPQSMQIFFTGVPGISPWMPGECCWASSRQNRSENGLGAASHLLLSGGPGQIEDEGPIVSHLWNPFPSFSSGDRKLLHTVLKGGGREKGIHLV